MVMVAYPTPCTSKYNTIVRHNSSYLKYGHQLSHHCEAPGAKILASCHLLGQGCLIRCKSGRNSESLMFNILEKSFESGLYFSHITYKTKTKTRLLNGWKSFSFLLCKVNGKFSCHSCTFTGKNLKYCNALH